MRAVHRALSAAFLLSGCAVQPPQEQATLIPAGALRCIALDQVVGQRVQGGALIYQVSNGTVYRNDLQGTCPSLRHVTGTEIAQIEPQGTQLCHGDTVRVFDPVVARTGGIESFPRCRAGYFVPGPAR